MNKFHTRDRAPMRRSLATAISLTLALGMAGPVLAQQAPADAPAEDAQQPGGAVTLDQVVVTANKRAENIREVATSVTVLHAGKVLSEGGVADVQADPRVQEVYLGTAA